ncbi:uncharacterized protein [Anabrus simplex]|uniref:uncharacterized protein n=1 Tax=Anabrus simplex TaxID=316456 RepID=UPI0035A2D286
MDGPGLQENIAGKNGASTEIKSEYESLARKRESGWQYVNRTISSHNGSSSSCSNSSSGFLEHIRCDVANDRLNGRLASNNDDNNIPSNGITDSDQEKPNCLSHNLNTNGLDSKTTKIKQIIEDALSPGSKQTVMNIVDQVNQLTMPEKLLLYLKLPTGKSSTVDPLRQPLNPLGSRYEIQQTITWIKTHLEEDPDVSLPKQDVYDEYLAYCNTNLMKPLSTADFGKVMKQVFPRVRPRRLGTRGNSRYCYAGMRKRMKLETPLLPDLGDSAKSTSEQCSEDEVTSAASYLIREWAEKLLGVRFDSLRDLACHLVDKLCVDSRSVAAFTLLSSSSQDKKCNGKGSTSPLGLSGIAAGGQASKHRETQLQLQRKLQEREVIREQKRKLQDQQMAAFSKGVHSDKPRVKRAKVSSKEKKGRVTNTLTQGNSLPPVQPQQIPTTSEAVNASICDNTVSSKAEVKHEEHNFACQDRVGHRVKSVECSGDSVTNSVSPLSNDPQLSHLKSVSSCREGADSVPSVTGASKKEMSVVDSVAGKRPVTNLQPTEASTNNNSNSNNNNSSSSSSNNNSTSNNNNNSNMNKFSTTFSPVHEVQNKGPSEMTSSASGTQIVCPPLLPVSLGSPPNKLRIPRVPNPKANVIIFPTATLAPQKPAKKKYKPIQPKPDNLEDKVKRKCDLDQEGSEVVKRGAPQVKDDSSGHLEKDALGDYFHGGNNSQEHEEELIRYFQHQTSSSSNEEGEENLPFRRSSTADPCKSDKLSQLRLLLERNLHSVPSGGRATTTVSFQPSNRSAEDQTCNDDVFLSNTKVHIPAGASASASLSLLSQRSQLQHQTNRNTSKLLPSLLTSGHGNTSGLSTRRRVSFETSVMEHYHNDQQHSVPPSPNTRRRIFSFTPISPGPQSPLSTTHQRTSSKPSSANASPFVSPRNTPVPRTRHAVGQNNSTNASLLTNTSFVASATSQIHGSNSIIRSRLAGSNAAKIVRSNSVNSGLPTAQYQPSARPRALSSTTPIQDTNTNIGLSSASLNDLLTLSHSSHFSASQNDNGTLMFTMPELQLSMPPTMSVDNARLNSTVPPPMSPLSISAPQSPLLNYSGTSVVVNSNDSQEVAESFSASESLLQAVLQSTTKSQEYNSNSSYLNQERALQTLEVSMAADTNGTVQHLLGSDPIEHEVSQFFPDGNSNNRQNFGQLQCRSQSVPLHRMATSTLVSPLSAQPSPLYLNQQSFTFNNFPSSAASSVAPTPVPSECMDFGISDSATARSTNILMVDGDGNDPETEGLNSENLNRIFNLLDDAQEQQASSLSLSLQIGSQQPQRSLLQPSRSYPNTPVPYKTTNERDPVVTSFTASAQAMEVSSRSLPPTPLLSVPLFGSSDDDAPFHSISESDAALTLNALNTRPSTARRNINALLVDDISLGELETLQECEDSFSQLVRDVEQPCSDT